MAAQSASNVEYSPAPQPESQETDVERELLSNDEALERQRGIEVANTIAQAHMWRTDATQRGLSRYFDEATESGAAPADAWRTAAESIRRDVSEFMDAGGPRPTWAVLDIEGAERVLSAYTESPTPTRKAVLQKRTWAEQIWDAAKQLVADRRASSQQPNDATNAEGMRASAERARQEIREHKRTAERAEIREMIGVKTNWQARRIDYEARFVKIIKPWVEREELLVRSHDRHLERSEEKLLKEYWKQQEKLASANTKIPTHLWGPKEWRASQKVREIENEIKILRGVGENEQVNAVRRQDGSVGVEHRAAQGVIHQRDAAETVFSQGVERETAPKESAREELLPSTNQFSRLAALEVAKKLRAGVPVGGWKKPGEKEMYDDIVKQLSRQDVSSIKLTAYYGGNDPKVARDVHEVAIERNMDVIEAVRVKGIPVDTGDAKLYIDLKKKTEIMPEMGRAAGKSEDLGMRLI